MTQREYSALKTLFAAVFSDETCCLCEQPPIQTNVLAMPFCAEHAFRMRLLDWGLAHDCPALDARPYGMPCTISHDAYHWYITACFGTDELVWTLLALIESEYGEVAA